MSNVEYIEQARKMLIDDYKNRHNDEYNSWRFNTQNAWRGENIPLPFPPFIYNPVLAPFQSTIPYPTEGQIAAKALELYSQTNPAGPTDDIAPSLSDDEPVTVIESVAEAEPEAEPAPAEEPAIEEATVETEPAPVAEESVAEPAPYVAEIQNIYKDVYQDYLENKISIDDVSTDEPAVDQQPADAQPGEPAVDEQAPESVIEQAPEPLIIEPVTEPDTYVSKIQDIYKDLVAAPAITVEDGVIPDVKIEPVPMPAEQLAKVSLAGEKLLPSVLRKIEELKMSWASKK